MCFFYFVAFSEIAKVRASLFQINGVRKEPLSLPDAEGAPVTLNEKVYVPVKEHPDVSRLYIFVGVFHFSLKILIGITIKYILALKHSNLSYL